MGSTRLGYRVIVAGLSFFVIASGASRADFLRVAIMGDSMSAGNGVGGGGTPNWHRQLNPTGAFTFNNWAQGGATSASVISGTQLSSVVNQAASNQIDVSVLIIGGNDATIGVGVAEALEGDSSIFANAYFNNVKLILDSVRAANPDVLQVFGNMPDVTVTPLVISNAAALGVTQAQLALLSQAIAEANTLANAYALSLGIPVIDLYHASRDMVTYTPWSFGGRTFNSIFASDQFHPSVLTQGLMANMVTTALYEAHGLALPVLSDQRIVINAGFTPNSLTTYFDISPYVLVPVPEMSSLGLLALSAVPLGAWTLARRGVARPRG